MSEDGSTRKDHKLQKKTLINNISQAINPIIKDLQNQDNCLQMPELALRCAQFFHSISQYCVSSYHNYVRQQTNKKRKMIKKQEKERGNKGMRRDRKREDDNEAQLKQLSKKLEPPKKPLTAYIIYFQDKKPLFVERYPTLGLSELTKLIAKQWKELSEAEKQVYLDRASQDRRRYEEQLSEFRSEYSKIFGKSNADFEVKEAIPEDEEIQAIINAQKSLEVPEPMAVEVPVSGKQEDNQSAKQGQNDAQNEDQEVEQQDANQAEQIDEEVDSQSQQVEANQAKNDSQQQSQGEQEQQGSAEVAASGENQEAEQ